MTNREQSLGTRFLLYPQSPSTPGYEKPEVTWISSPAGTVLAGPADDRMYVVDPAAEKDPYDYPLLPPFAGECLASVEPGPDGHFDHLRPGTRAFNAAHAFGALRRCLDIWEGYLGHKVVWHFADHYERLEIIPNLRWDNAQSGYGYMEFGQDLGEGGDAMPFALNFDVIAHELGHAILFSEIGLPPDGVPAGDDFVAYHEGVSDLVSLVAMLHFDTAADRLLRRTSGNLLALNELNRVAELSNERQIRIAGNSRKMSEVSDEAHDKSRPFTGAFFDAMVEIYHREIVAQKLVDLPASSITDARDLDDDVERVFAAAFADGYELKHFKLKAILADARDLMGMALARSWAGLDPTSLTYAGAAAAVVDALVEAGRPDAAEILVDCLAWREILTPFDIATLGNENLSPKGGVWP